MKRLGGDRMDAAHVPGRSVRSRRFAPKYALRLRADTASRTASQTATWGTDAIHAAGFSGARARDFEDFVAGDRGLGAGLVPLPDPSFRESLRRQLWRIQVLGRRNRGSATH
jgi:hypothetical protein